MGQTPPPFHGQAVVIRALLDSRMPDVTLAHVRMAYSDSIEEVGRLRIRKGAHLASVIWRTLSAIRRFRPDVVYYPPSPRPVPLVRDAVTLLAIRPFCPRIVFHFHAGGLCEALPRYLRVPVVGRAVRRAFFHPDGAVMLSRWSPPDGQFLGARRIYYLPHGIPDEGRRAGPERRSRARPRVLFVGSVTAAKGADDLVRGCRLLWDGGRDFDVVLVGTCQDSFRRELERMAGPHRGRMRFTGALSGQWKWDRYAEADVFCFPSKHPTESLPVVCMEAAMFGLPSVATRWRGIRDTVEDGATGYLVDRDRPDQIADRLDGLLADAELRRSMGRAARAKYEREFRAERFAEDWRRVFREVARGGDPTTSGRPAQHGREPSTLAEVPA
ncbi:MAG: glycosyltransferase family 4 protein [Actinomycetota bacterium]|nr:glycosyltransferase family 4 protein [Actinomycetota bacterium]